MVPEPEILSQLHLALDYLSDDWPIQNNCNDNLTRLIYKTHSFTELCSLMDKSNIDQDTRNYAIHRWFNKETSELCESFFIKYGAQKASDDANLKKHTDVYINHIPFDIKLTVFPKRLNYPGPDKLDFRDRRDELIHWFYNSQSTEQRNAFNNRIFIVCCGETVHQRNALKLDVNQIEAKICAFMDHLSNHTPVHKVKIISQRAETYEVSSEIIVIKPYATDFFLHKGKMNCQKCGAPYKLIVSTRDIFSGSFLLKCPNCYNYTNV